MTEKIAVSLASGIKTSAVEAEPLGASVESFIKGNGFLGNLMSSDFFWNSRWIAAKFASDCFKGEQSLKSCAIVNRSSKDKCVCFYFLKSSAAKQLGVRR